MDAMFDICYLTEGNTIEPDDIPQTKESVWLLGKKYSAIQGSRPLNNVHVTNHSRSFLILAFAYRFGPYTSRYYLHNLVHVPQRFCANRRRGSYFWQGMGLHAALWADGAWRGPREDPSCCWLDLDSGNEVPNQFWYWNENVTYRMCHHQQIDLGLASCNFLFVNKLCTSYPHLNSQSMLP